MKRGEVRWYRFRSPDKRRPVLILTRDSILEYLGEVTVAPVTTTIREIPTEVSLSREDGVLRDCVVNLDHLQTVPRKKLGSLLAKLSPEKMAQVGSALRFALGL